jgi:hypothetical protein
MEGLMNVHDRLLRRQAARWAPFVIVVTMAAAAAAPPYPSPGLLTVHEWGTFVSMEGSDGLALEGLHHDEADLPAFVHSRSRDQLRLHATISKLETPVLYFYPSGSQPASQVSVRVDFPEGIITQWFPQATLSSPRLLQGDAAPPLKGGYMQWYGVLTPDSATGSPAAGAALPPTEPGHVWNFTRQTRSAFVTTGVWDWYGQKQVNEREKFIFYRGLGRFDPPLQVQTETEGRVRLANIGVEPLNDLFLLRVENGRGTFQYFPTLGAGQKTGAQIVMDAEAMPLNEFVGRIGQALGARLVEQRLYADEAQAMVNTWSRSYFRTPGIRVLYIVPRAQIDRNLPLKVQGVTIHGFATPTKLERVFVGRVECLTPEEEARINGWLRDLASTDAERAAAARNGLIALGRFAEPHLRRAMQNSSDPTVRARAQALLANDAISELVAAERAFPQEVDVTARLAALERRAGLTAEAKAKGEAALAVLQAHVPPQPAANDKVFNSSDPARRRWLRSMAFAREAIGDPGPAADAYADWVNFAAGVKGSNCQTCHKDALVKPLTYSDLRDWWGGERLRSFAIASGKTEALIAAAQERLKANASDPQALVTLGYLLPARGDTQAAEQAWAKLGVGAPQP